MNKNETQAPWLRLPRVCALLLVCLGISVFIGWWLDITLLKSIFPGIVSMNPLTALSFILCGSTLFLISGEEVGRKAKLFAICTGVFVIVVGATRLYAILGGMDLGLDQIIFREKILAVTSFAKNRIAPNTALNFILIGIGFIALVSRRFLKLAHLLAFLTSMIGLLAIVGYLYSVQNLYGFLAYTPMALNTALAFCCVATGIISARSDQGLMRVIGAKDTAGIMSRWLIPFVVGVPAALGYARLLGQNKGFYNTEYGAALLVVSFVMIFLIFVYYVASYIHKIDLNKQVIDKAKTEFVSLASHQLRTPATAVKWYTELLLENKEISKETRTLYTTAVYDANERMIELINSLLNVSRIELGHLAVDPIPVDFLKLCKDEEKGLAPLLSEKEIHIVWKGESEIPPMIGDPKLLGVIIQNLLSNAVKYTPHQGLVQIEFSRRGENLSMVVTDTGIGIPKEQQQKIFTKMFRAENAAAQHTDGNGLGLYLTKAIVEIMDGEISFVSEENKGTAFHVMIPLLSKNKKEGVLLS